MYTMKKFLFVILFILSIFGVWCQAMPSSVPSKTKSPSNNLTQSQNEIQILRAELVQTQKILDIQIQAQQQKIDNARWHIDGILTLMLLVGGLMGFMMYRENNKATTDMKYAKNQYNKASEMTNNALKSVKNCTVKAEKILHNVQNKTDKLFKNAKNKIDVLSDEAANKAILAIKEEQEKNAQCTMLIQQFNASTNAQQYKLALDIADQLIKKDANLFYGYWGKAIALYKLNENPNIAIENINKALELNKNSNKDSMYDLRACIYTANKDFNLALEDRERIKDTSVGRKLNYIELLMIMGKYEEASKELLSTKVQVTEKDQANFYITNSMLQILQGHKFELEPTKAHGNTWQFDEIKKTLLSNTSTLPETIKENLANFVNKIERINAKK